MTRSLADELAALAATLYDEERVGTAEHGILCRAVEALRAAERARSYCVKMLEAYRAYGRRLLPPDQGTRGACEDVLALLDSRPSAATDNNSTKET